MMRELIGARVELRVGQRLRRSNTTRWRIGRSRHLCGKQLGQGAGWHRTRRVVPFTHDGVALRRQKECRSCQSADPDLRPPLRAAAAAASAMASTVVAIEQIGCVFDRAVDAGGRSVRGALLAERQGQIEFGDAGRDRLRRPSSVPAAQS